MPHGMRRVRLFATARCFTVVNRTNSNILCHSCACRRLENAKTLVSPSSLLSTRQLASHAKMASLTYLKQELAQKIDKELFDDYKFSIDQLMELAGLSVATAVAHSYTLKNTSNKNVLVIVGPGNNGGDGLVAARHLKLFGYLPVIYYPKRTDKELFANLVTQCTQMGIEILDALPAKSQEFVVVIDALFGFSFKPPVREELQPAMNYLLQATSPICSVDVPSGWPVDGFLGEKQSSDGGDFIEPDCLISLMAPKICSKQFKGTHHWLGGRFCPDAVIEKYRLSLPDFPGTSLVVNLKNVTLPAE